MINLSLKIELNFRLRQLATATKICTFTFLSNDRLTNLHGMSLVKVQNNVMPMKIQSETIINIELVKFQNC